MMRRLAALTDDTERMVLHDRCAANSAQETLLHSTFEAEHCDFGGGNLNLDCDLTEGDPGNEHTGMVSKSYCERGEE